MVWYGTTVHVANFGVIGPDTTEIRRWK